MKKKSSRNRASGYPAERKSAFWQKANLMTQIIVAVFTVALSNMVNAIGEGTSEAMKKSVTIGSVCIIILGGMLSAYHTKKSMEKIKRRIPNW